MSYFGNRQNPLNNVPAQECEEVFKAIADHFSLKWLNSRGAHPLQMLWHRNDTLATNELFSFGAHLKKLNEVDPKWTKKQVAQIKTGQSNNQLGAFFEIAALGILATDKQNVKPTKGNNPGFDGILSFDDSKEMRISLKNYGMSAAQRDFQNNAAILEKELPSMLKARKITASQIIVDAVKGYPEKNDWVELKKQLPLIIDEYEVDNPKSFAVNEFWLVIIGDLKNEDQEFHPFSNSYTLLITSIFHKNEQKNLFDKLDDACNNLTKHSSVEDHQIINVAFVHLPLSASILSCKKWAQEYFDHFPQKPITGIILYQPTVATDLEKDTTFIHHFSFIIVSKWLLEKTVSDTGIIRQETLLFKCLLVFLIRNRHRIK